jgi:hypothetical protein
VFSICQRVAEWAEGTHTLHSHTGSKPAKCVTYRGYFKWGLKRGEAPVAERPSAECRPARWIGSETGVGGTYRRFRGFCGCVRLKSTLPIRQLH